MILILGCFHHSISMIWSWLELQNLCMATNCARLTDCENLFGGTFQQIANLVPWTLWNLLSKASSKSNGLKLYFLTLYHCAACLSWQHNFLQALVYIQWSETALSVTLTFYPCKLTNNVCRKSKICPILGKIKMLIFI